MGAALWKPARSLSAQNASWYNSCPRAMYIKTMKCEACHFGGESNSLWRREADRKSVSELGKIKTILVKVQPYARELSSGAPGYLSCGEIARSSCTSTKEPPSSPLTLDHLCARFFLPSRTVTHSQPLDSFSQCTK